LSALTRVRPAAGLLLLLCAFASPATGDPPEAEPAAAVPSPFGFPDSALEPLAWASLEGWAADDHAAAFAAFLPSCRALVAGARLTNDARPMRAGLIAVCRRALAAVPLDGAGARAFFEDNFRPVRITKLEEQAGFLTGYYEPIVEGSRVLTDDFKVPLYRRPHDLVHLGRKRKAEGFPNTGRVVRRLNRRKFVPYFERAEIEDGALATRNLEICYLKSFDDALFIHIQGSARVRLEDGTVVRVNYDAHNGHRYTPVGRILIERNIIAREDMSMTRIREWMAANPEGAKELRRQNKSFVFFRDTGLPEHEEARGAQGVPLTAVRSIAVDRALHVYGTPFFVAAELPIATGNSDTKFRRLMIAQDTGSAIVGPARADIYFGAGEDAGRIAGRIKNPGRFVMLLPRELDMAEAGKRMPLPVAAPVKVSGDEKPAATQPAATQPMAEPAPVPRPRPRT
jgi:peptidoglycan lytic transglycosylase A